MTVRSPVAICIVAPSTSDMACTWPVHCGSAVRASASVRLPTSGSEFMTQVSVGFEALRSRTSAKSMPLPPLSGTLWKNCGT